MDAHARPGAVALAACAQFPASCPDDAHLRAALDAAGVPHEVVPWDAPGVGWERYGAVMVRATWDYYLRPEAFAAWLRRLEEAGAAVWNPVPVLRWNMHKGYLRDLARRGVPVVPTRFVERGESPDLAAVMDAEGWDACVVKPAVSAGAHRTFRAARAEAPARQAELAAVARDGGALVQPYLPEVARDGEWSLVFLDGAFSHAVRKHPRGGDFRVQEKHGGSLHAAAAPGGLVAQAERVLAAAGAALLYARVDGVAREGKLLLMELEVLEPELFFRLGPGSAARCAAALRARMRRRAPA